MARRSVFAALLLVAPGLHALNVGDRYDFFCSDGQDVYNAELTREDTDHYYVRLSPVLDQVPIEKQFVVQTVPRSIKPVQATEPTARFEISLGAGLDVAAGKLSAFAKTAPKAAASATFWWRQNWAFFARLSAEEFRASPAFLRSFGAHAGMWWRVPLTYYGFSLLTGAAPGGALLAAQTTGFSETAIAFSFLAAARVQYTYGSRWIFFLEPSATYIYDSETVILLPGIQAGAAFRW